MVVKMMANLQYPKIGERGSKTFWIYYLSIFLLFLFIPIFWLLYSFVNVCKSGTLQEKKTDFYLFFLLLSSWLGMVNMTKVPASDQMAYLSLYLKADSLGFHESLFNGVNGGGVEFMYGLYVWISHYLWLGNGAIFFCVTTIIIYMLHFISVYRVFDKMNMSTSELLCGILALAFFSQYFNLTNHLVRQMLAVSLALFGFCDRIVGGKRWYVWLIVSCLTHTSAALVAAMAFIPSLYHRMSRYQLSCSMALFGMTVAFITLFNDSLSGMDSGVSVINHGLSKVAVGGGKDSVVVPISLILIVVLPLLYGVYNGLRHEENDDSPLYPIGYLCTGLCIFVLSLSNSPLMQYRFFYFTYSFIPFVIPFLVSRLSPHRLLFDILVPSFLIVRFFVTLDSQQWTYAPVTDLLSLPLVYYIFHSPLNY